MFVIFNDWFHIGRFNGPSNAIIGMNNRKGIFEKKAQLKMFEFALHIGVFDKLCLLNFIVTNTVIVEFEISFS